ncbi:MAG: hypothetical protein FJY37_17760 [Betaproteobacteria bacterium]|nr:hypothetical protein [Betaproteobacteria bacterium]
MQHANITRLPDSQRAFWDEVTDGVSSAQVQDAWRRKYRITLEQVSRKPMAALEQSAGGQSYGLVVGPAATQGCTRVNSS